MPLVQTADLRPDGLGQTGYGIHQIYCGLDSMLTHEIHSTLRSLAAEPPIYAFTRALQAPYMEITQRGFLVDETARRHAIAGLEVRRDALRATLDRLARAVWDKGLNPNSPAQMKDFLYGAMALPEVVLSKKGERRVSTDREALEKLEQYLHARPIIYSVLALRDIGKQLAVMTGGMSAKPDGSKRFHAGYNVTGTETGRSSSSSNAFGEGGNAQNWAPGMRYVLQADKGKKIAVVDLEQAEARDVGFIQGCLFDDWKFLDNCESGDLHTNNAKLIWPELPWTGEPKADRKIAERNFYREYSHRDMSKRGGHLSNYYGTAYTAARSLKVPIGIMNEFQARYCRGDDCAFPAHQRWWKWTYEQLQTTHTITTPFGRERQFFGRPDDDTTLREAIAFTPQSMTGDRMNLGMWRVWKHMPGVQLLAQGFDSITFQYDDDPRVEEKVLTEVLERIRVPLYAPSGRLFIIPGEAKIGWNWGAVQYHQDTKEVIGNPLGLVKWFPGRKETRSRGVGAASVAP